MGGWGDVVKMDRFDMHRSGGQVKPFLALKPEDSVQVGKGDLEKGKHYAKEREYEKIKYAIGCFMNGDLGSWEDGMEALEGLCRQYHKERSRAKKSQSPEDRWMNV